MKKSLSGLIAVVVTTLGMVVPASAGVVELAFNTLYTEDGVEPAGPIPWFTATFTDIGPNKVRLNIVSFFVSGSPEHIKQVNFNIDPSLNGGDLSGFAFTQTVGPTAVSSQAIANTFNTGPAVQFDMEFTWAPDQLFMDPDLEVEFILEFSGLTAASFLFQNLGDLNGPHFYATAHVGGTGDDGLGSAWVGAQLIPLPQTWILLAFGLVLVPVLRRRFGLVA